MTAAGRRCGIALECAREHQARKRGGEAPGDDTGPLFCIAEWWIEPRNEEDWNPVDNRGERTRTSDLIVPNDARYQAAPHPENMA